MKSLNVGREILKAVGGVFAAYEWNDSTKMPRAWHSKVGDIGYRVWRQIKLGLSSERASSIPDPLWYHMDEAIEFDPTTELPIRNGAAYMINRAREFDKRPGVMPHADREAPFYGIANGQWVVAGMFTKTFTRLSTMESGVESARHAVNAILHDIAMRRRGGGIMGDLAPIYNLEDDEIDDFAALKRIDEELMRRNLPHAMDILRVEEVAEAMLGKTESGESMATEMFKLLQSALKVAEGDQPFRDVANERIQTHIDAGIDQLARSAHDLVQRLMKPFESDHRRD